MIDSIDRRAGSNRPETNPAALFPPGVSRSTPSISRRRFYSQAARWSIVFLVLAFAVPSPAAAECHAVGITPNTPTGIAGCERFGEGIASHYGPGIGVAMNFCTWTLRHSTGCGVVTVTSLDTWLSVVAPVVDFGDLYTGTPDERIVDLQWGVVDALGLDRAKGLYRVRVERSGASSRDMLPNTAMENR